VIIEFEYKALKLKTVIIESSFAHIIFKLIRFSVFGLLSVMEGLKEAASLQLRNTPQWDYQCLDDEYGNTVLS